jgi:hypothetical protein
MVKIPDWLSQEFIAATKRIDALETMLLLVVREYSNNGEINDKLLEDAYALINKSDDDDEG